jgi:catechol 2,3-dioxygenase-like lactoylglutathione lyase family enzyme
VSVPGLEAFHFGFVVRDLDAVTGLYGRMLDITRWRSAEFDMSVMPWVDRPSDARLRIAVGHAAGQTFEFIQVLSGHSVHSEFLEQHGEGVQHIGFWCPDVRNAVTAAVAEGARVVCAFLQDPQHAVIQLTPSSSAMEVAQAVNPGRMAYVDPGIATVQFEFCGPASQPGLREWLAEEYQQELR